MKEKKDDFYYLGKKYDLIFSNIFDKVSIKNDKILASNLNEVNNWLNEKIKTIFKERFDYNYNLVEEKIPYPKLKIRKMKTRWGVCNRKNISVTLNSELIKYELDKLDYVIMHELAHLTYFDHSKNFWNLVSKYVPDYKKIKKELRG